MKNKVLSVRDTVQPNSTAYEQRTALYRAKAKAFISLGDRNLGVDSPQYQSQFKDLTRVCLEDPGNVDIGVTLADLRQIIKLSSSLTEELNFIVNSVLRKIEQSKDQQLPNKLREDFFWNMFKAFSQPLTEMGVNVKVYIVDKLRVQGYSVQTFAKFYNDSGFVGSKRFVSRFSPSNKQENRIVPNNEAFFHSLTTNDKLLFISREETGQQGSIHDLKDFFSVHITSKGRDHLLKLEVFDNFRGQIVGSEKAAQLLILPELLENFTTNLQSAIDMFDTVIRLRNRSLDLEKDAYFDGLTKLIAAKRYEEVFEKALLKAVRDKKNLAFLEFDLDYFSFFNDVFGHSVGDIILQEFSSCLSGLFRKTDFIVRKGGEEIVVILPDASQKDLVKLYEKLQGQLVNLSNCDKMKPHITVSDQIVAPDEKKVHVKSQIKYGLGHIQPICVSAGGTDLQEILEDPSIKRLIKEHGGIEWVFKQKDLVKMIMGLIFTIADDRLLSAKESGRNCIYIESGSNKDHLDKT
ncbi:MAG: hypothetical protein A2X42_08750 [Candidatus Margulisbacteria bacterium GWF2_38_17]|nr:MAG: hypothetical protein A2X43_06370 [Candidatus Margulisbacteria bacterium GWD2_39_127]OGI05574.1 MAG: hypothetical protein A2X42_08750 [Candidatus Margulisbacteria bacterium GWF2_38_17]OGI07531.1 MAG: hypothetical protein A2X41_08655 [Candidatus Margulisbacteria bacterium GWE2_39_32]